MDIFSYVLVGTFLFFCLPFHALDRPLELLLCKWGVFSPVNQHIAFFEWSVQRGFLSPPDPTVWLYRERYRLRVRASDRGKPPSHADVDVELDVVDRNNKPPLWDSPTYGPIHIRENVTVGTVVTAVKARYEILFVCPSASRTNWRQQPRTRGTHPSSDP